MHVMSQYNGEAGMRLRDEEKIVMTYVTNKLLENNILQNIRDDGYMWQRCIFVLFFFI